MLQHTTTIATAETPRRSVLHTCRGLFAIDKQYGWANRGRWQG